MNPTRTDSTVAVPDRPLNQGSAHNPSSELSSLAMGEFESVGSIAALVRKAQSGDDQAAGRLLESYRNYLKAIADRRFAPPLRQRLDPSDVVQETMMDAHRGMEGILTDDEHHLRAVLRKILLANIANAVRDHLMTEKRNANQEASRSVDSAQWSSSLTSPSMAMADRERAVRLLQMMEQLPEDQATAVRMRYFESASVSEIAEATNRSRSAAAGLLKRGLVCLRTQLAEESW